MITLAYCEATIYSRCVPTGTWIFFSTFRILALILFSAFFCHFCYIWLRGTASAKNHIMYFHVNLTYEISKYWTKGKHIAYISYYSFIRHVAAGGMSTPLLLAANILMKLIYKSELTWSLYPPPPTHTHTFWGEFTKLKWCEGI